MKNTIMKNTVKLISIAIIMVLCSCSSESLTESETFEQLDEIKYEVAIKDHNFNDIQGALSTIYRSKNGITANFKTTNLIPNNAYTLWWVVFGETQGPPNITYAAGHISAGIGAEIFFAHKSADPSFNNPLTAEVHLVLHSHGQAVPGMIFDQIQTQNEGCLEVLPSGRSILHEDSDELDRCANIQVAIHPSVN